MNPWHKLERELCAGFPSDVISLGCNFPWYHCSRHMLHSAERLVRDALLRREMTTTMRSSWDKILLGTSRSPSRSAIDSCRVALISNVDITASIERIPTAYNRLFYFRTVLWMAVWSPWNLCFYFSMDSCYRGSIVSGSVLDVMVPNWRDVHHLLLSLQA